jgi:hypothetical protein
VTERVQKEAQAREAVCDVERDGIDVSLSRLNHWLARGQTPPEVVQGPAQFHHESADARLPQPDPILHNATALHTAVDMFDPEPALGQGLVRHLLRQRSLLATWLLGGHANLHLRQRERQEAQLLQQAASGR